MVSFDHKKINVKESEKKLSTIKEMSEDLTYFTNNSISLK